MWDHKYLARIDLRVVAIIFFLMGISIVVISSMTIDSGDVVSDTFMTPYVRSQLEWFLIGWMVFLFFSGLDYRKLRDWSWILYFFMMFLLLGLYFANPIQSVHRWYRLPFIGMNVQPSEYAKLIVVICLSWFLEKKQEISSNLLSSLQAVLIVGFPFLLILKQPDLGTALVLYPISLVMFYFAGIHKMVFKSILLSGVFGVVISVLMFGGAISHEKLKPICTSVMKEYQYDRLNPNTYHQKAAKISIAIGGVTGSGWHKSEFSSKKWLPAAHTDSVFAGIW